MRYATLIVATLGLLAVALLLSSWDRFTARLTEPAGTSAVPITVVVRPGDTLASVVSQLAQRGLIRDIETVQDYLTRFHDPRPLTPGEYELNQAMGPAELVAHLESGRRVKRPLSIPEGATVRGAATVLDKAGIVAAEAFITAAEDRVVAERLGIEGGRVEGYLLPDVYAFVRGSSATKVLETMVRRFDAIYAQTVGDQTNGLNRAQIVTLASLIETAPIPRAERRQFSALLRNRIRGRIPLQIEAARDYAEQRPPEDRPKWDTFSRPGLPPGPICSPGTGAMLAAADPATSRALYFVVRPDGSYAYCDDLDCLYEESRRHKQPLPSPLPLPLPEAAGRPKVFDPATAPELPSEPPPASAPVAPSSVQAPATSSDAPPSAEPPPSSATDAPTSAEPAGAPQAPPPPPNSP